MGSSSPAAQNPGESLIVELRLFQVLCVPYAMHALQAAPVCLEICRQIDLLPTLILPNVLIVKGNADGASGKSRCDNSCYSRYYMPTA